MKIISIVGARPNFMKIAPFIRAINKYNQSLPFAPSPHHPITLSPHRSFAPSLPHPITHILVHTGQHYDDKMSRSFFEALNIPDADINLEVGSGSHAEQVGYTMIKLEKVLEKEKPDWVVVVGDVNATLAASVTAKKLHIKVCHIEAGLRSGDITMPEEINRLVTDRLSDLLLTPDLLSNKNLLKEGVDKKKIKFVGNIMIDTLEANRKKAENLDISELLANNMMVEKKIKQIENNNYAVVTLHRPSNVDKGEIFSAIIEFIIDRVSTEMPVIWPIHPRAKKQVELLGFWNKLTNAKNMFLLHPVGYHEMLKLNMGARLFLTDSGGLQEECTILGTPCLTLRWNTERPVTLKEHGGVSVLVGNDINKISKEYSIALQQKRNPARPELWDGKTAERIVNEIINATN